MAKRSKIDINRVAAAAVEAAFEDERQPRRRLSGVTAVAAGAALVAVGRVAVKKVPSALLPSVPSLSNLTDGVRDRLAEHGWLDEEDDVENEPLDEAEEWDEPQDEAEEWDEPEDEEDDEQSEDGDEWDDEDDDESGDDEPEGSGDEEPEDDEEDVDEEEDDEEESAPGIEIGASTNGGGETDRGAPDLMGALSGRRRPPVMRSAERRRNPAAQPPARPKRKSKSGKG